MSSALPSCPSRPFPPRSASIFFTGVDVRENHAEINRRLTLDLPRRLESVLQHAAPLLGWELPDVLADALERISLFSRSRPGRRALWPSSTTRRRLTAAT